ncbi:ROK family protein [Brachybacterium paraconglomeratum]|uniref:ROK family protein n=1 Tax=Brachybacterium paraconglomeratum TaxID=173362 RepID=UPI00223B9F72|nr:ROK family protein [Brachybacterium paraconglomeratum]MCT1435879.1 ROK family protein [Brachybacterium paraconglomeratum]
MTTLLALDIGGTKTTAALVGHDGEAAAVLAARTVPTPAQDGPDAVLDAADAALRTVREDGAAGSAPAPPHALGIASAGVVAPGTGRITHATDAIRGWAGTELGAALAARQGLPTAVLNDVQAHGLGEAHHGVGRGRRSLLLVAVGTGIGAGLVTDGQVLTGGQGAAGHLGHLPVAAADGVPCPCGRTGHLEGLASGPGILALARRLGAPERITRSGQELAAAARAGQEQALAAYRIAGGATGAVIGGALNLLDVEVIALTGGVVGASREWEEALRAAVREQTMDVVATTEILPARAGVHAALLGAAEHARRTLCIPS